MERAILSLRLQCWMQELTSTIILAGWCFHQIFPPLKGVTGLFDCYSQEELVWRTGLRHSAVLLSRDGFKERELPNMTIFLLEQGASPNGINSDIGFFLAFISWDCVSLLRLLVRYGLDLHKGAAGTGDDIAKECSPMHIASKAGNLGIFQLLEENAVRPMVYLNGIFSWRDVGAA